MKSPMILIQTGFPMFAATCLAVLTAMAPLTACRTGEKEVSGAYAYTAATFDATCLGVEGDGSQRMRVWGQGKDCSQAIEQAKINAVETVLFQGIKADGPCATHPLVPQVNAREKHQEYFDRFFAHKGSYSRFVKEVPGGTASRVKAKGPSQEAYAINVVVDVPSLRLQLVKDHILAE